MQTVSAKIFSLIAMLLFFATVGLRLFMLLFDLSGFTVTILYCLLSAAVAATAYNALRVKSYSQAFNFKSHFISTLCHISAHSAFSPILSTDASAFTTASNQPSIKAVCISLFSASRAQQLFCRAFILSPSEFRSTI